MDNEEIIRLKLDVTDAKNKVRELQNSLANVSTAGAKALGNQATGAVPSGPGAGGGFIRSALDAAQQSAGLAGATKSELTGMAAAGGLVGGAAGAAAAKLASDSWTTAGAAFGEYMTAGGTSQSAALAANQTFLGTILAAAQGETGGADETAKTAAAATAQVQGITSQIARYGGTVTPEFRDQQEDLALGMQSRADNESLQVLKDMKDRLGEIARARGYEHLGQRLDGLGPDVQIKGAARR